MSNSLKTHSLAVKDATTKTISSGVITIDQFVHVVAAETGTTDDLDTINLDYDTLAFNSINYRPLLALIADTGDTITLKHGTDNIDLPSDTDVDISDDAYILLFYDGTNWSIFPGTGISSSNELYTAYAIIRDEKATTTAGGGASATTWNARDVNTELVDADNIVTISSNQFTPIAGDYDLFAYAPSYDTDTHRLRLYNVTGTSSVEEGQNAQANSANNVQTTAFLSCKFTANGTDAYRIDHYTLTAKATSGLGIAVSDGSNEVYLVIVLRKLA